MFVFTLILVAELLKAIQFEGSIKASNTFFLFDLILAPLTFLYAKSISQRKKADSFPVWLHLTGPILANCTYLMYHVMTNWDQHLLNDQNFGSFSLATVYLKIGFQIIYQIMAIYVLSAAIRNHKIKPYEPAKIHLMKLIRGILSVVIVLLPLVIALEDSYQTTLFSSDDVTNIIMIFSIYSIGYIALKNPLVYSRDIELGNKRAEKRNGKSSEAGLSSEIIESHALRLSQLMEHDRLYTRPDLSLEELAEAMSLNRHNLSQVINEGLNQSFFDFVNSWRLKDFENRIRQGDHQQINILAVGLESGFNSKATLYRAFKKHYGVAPKEYLKNLK